LAARRPTYLFQLSRHFEKRVLSDTLRQEKSGAKKNPAPRKIRRQEKSGAKKKAPLARGQVCFLGENIQQRTR
jgi:hypothetical protein